MLFVILSKTLALLGMESLSFIACLVFAVIPKCFHLEATLKDFPAKNKGQGYFLGEGGQEEGQEII